MHVFWLAAVLALLGNAVHAQPLLLDLATISMSAPQVPRLTSNSICATDGTDLLCDRDAFLLSGGLISTTRISATNVSASVGDFTTLRVGGVSITGAGTSRLASLTDVSLSGLTTGQIIRFNGTSWTNVNVQDAISTTTMVAGWPDSLRCGDSTGTPSTWHLGQSNDGGFAWYYRIGVTNSWINFNASTGAWNSRGSGSEAGDCATKSIATLYSEGKAFNFIGGSGTVTPTVDRMVSGTSNAIINSATGIISFTQLGVATAYLHPTLGYVGPGVSTTGPISATSLFTGGLLTATRVTATSISASVGDFTTLRVGGVSITGAGTSRLASLTDVSLSGLTTGQIIRFNGTSWTNVNVQDAISTTTMVAGWPDSLRCGDSTGTPSTWHLGQSNSGGFAWYYRTGTSSVWINFNASTGAWNGRSSGSEAGDCATKSIATLYSEGKAFNFIGGSGSVSSTTPGGVSGSIQFNSGGTFAGRSDVVLDSAGNLGLAVTSPNAKLEVSGTISTTQLHLARTDGSCAGPVDAGRMFRDTTRGRLVLCVSRP